MGSSVLVTVEDEGDHGLYGAGNPCVDDVVSGFLTEGTVPDRIPFDESERRPSPNAYALSKYLSEVIADSLAVRYPDTAWVGLRINNVIPPDTYDRFAAEWDDPALSKGNFWS